ncbi:hypothetical protein M9M90_05085 [Phenylobacterium sp. LH3H17]|uniref:hypothetical protein n=1 Tax=Phenylobacterium sp. LH3H17 TaxID=2903901 RepID=UPI0020CA25E1|nr:hypothetical protein [Phenylobacterium sp. LH3H17]UTP40560.1 hypothetical protein M9M90_05085 [Phenylobacterium sp. LH3H17]
MAYQINTHVQRLHRYLPFDASFDQIYEENRNVGDSLEIETRALHYLKTVLADTARLVILTGDAGHGKTHLCNRVLREVLGYSADAARTAIKHACDGRLLMSDRPGGRPLRVFKDFSEVTPAKARDLLKSAAADPDSATVVCVNEGRLRTILAGDGDLADVALAFLQSFASGRASTEGRLHIVNLNYQSVAAGDAALVERVLSGEGRMLGWLAPRRWAVCDSCDAKPGCPMARNAVLLEGATGVGRRARIRDVMALMERLGVVITIREILMTVAYVLTGGLKCEDVHQRFGRQADGWQAEYMFYSLLFAGPRTLSRDRLARIPVLAEIAALDPGLVADRRVDERLINDADVFVDPGFELRFRRRIGGREALIDATHGIDEIIADARSGDERHTEAEFTREVIRNLRRRDFFEGAVNGLEAARLGFSHYDDFRFLLSGESDNSRRVTIKNRLITGLHTIQGLRLPASGSTLHLVDPAFGRSTSSAAIIARKIGSSQIRLLPQSEGWEVRPDDPYALRGAVDWIERAVLLTVDLGGGERRQHPLDLLSFDCIMRAASGYLPEAFYAHDIRRILNFLGLLAERSAHDSNDSISVMVGGALHTVTLEEGGVIGVSKG